MKLLKSVFLLLIITFLSLFTWNCNNDNSELITSNSTNIRGGGDDETDCPSNLLSVIIVSSEANCTGTYRLIGSGQGDIPFYIDGSGNAYLCLTPGNYSFCSPCGMGASATATISLGNQIVYLQYPSTCR